MLIRHGLLRTVQNPGVDRPGYNLDYPSSVMLRHRLSHTSSLGRSVLFIMTGFAYIILYGDLAINTVLLLYHAQLFYFLLESNNVTYVQGKQYIQYSISPQNIRGVWIQRKIFFQRYYILKMWIFFYFGTCWETNKKLKNTTDANKNIKVFLNNFISAH